MGERIQPTTTRGEEIWIELVVRHADDSIARRIIVRDVPPVRCRTPGPAAAHDRRLNPTLAGRPRRAEGVPRRRRRGSIVPAGPPFRQPGRSRVQRRSPWGWRQRQATTVSLPGYGGAATDTAAVDTFVQSNNKVSPPAW